MDIQYLILPEEHENPGDLKYEMRMEMKSVVEQLTKALVKENNPFPYDNPFPGIEPSLSGSESIRQEIKNSFIPFLFEIRKGLNEDAQNDLPEIIWFQEHFCATRIVFAHVLDLGLLSPAFPAARIALDELANCDIVSFQTAALLALLYCGFSHPKLDDINIYDTIKSGLLFKIPLQMLQKILPGLTSVFDHDKRSRHLLMDLFGNRMNKYQRAEVAIFLANLVEFNPMVLDECLLGWAEWLEPTNPIYHAYRIRCLKAAAKLISVNQKALAYYIEKITEGVGDRTDNDVNDWINPLLYLDSDNISADLLPQLFSVADALFKDHRYQLYMKAIRAYIKFANNGKYMEDTRNWLLTRLKSADIYVVHLTLEGIENLEPVDDTFKRQILTFLEANNRDKTEYVKIKTLAVNLVVKWKVKEAKPILEILAKNVEDASYDQKKLAASAANALKTFE